jgi:hypothetical protein
MNDFGAGCYRKTQNGSFIKTYIFWAGLTCGVLSPVSLKAQSFQEVVEYSLRKLGTFDAL